MEENSSRAIKDKFLAGAAALVLLVCYMLLMWYGRDTKFIEGAFLVVLGVFGGLLRQTSSPQTNVTGDSGTTTVVSKGS